ncbi:MAG: DUF309 domain-containing protein [Firmicutes bacterium]|nr:DUF309 domain-containing protein [Bacillota bacterium]
MDAWQAYVDAMHAARFYEAHELLESLWRATKSDKAQIAIWIAAAFLHWQRQNVSGALTLFRRTAVHPLASEMPLASEIQGWIAAVESEAPVVPPARALLLELADWGRRE